jgi:hypothetical protein
MMSSTLQKPSRLAALPVGLLGTVVASYEWAVGRRGMNAPHDTELSGHSAL